MLLLCSHNTMTTKSSNVVKSISGKIIKQMLLTIKEPLIGGLLYYMDYE